MIKYYDPSARYGTHVIRVTFMMWDYVGRIAFEIKGNCRGTNVLDDSFLDCDDEEDIDRYVENDCDFACDAELEVFRATLHNDESGLLDVEWDPEEARNAIVSMEIVDFKEDTFGGTHKD